MQRNRFATCNFAQFKFAIDKFVRSGTAFVLVVLSLFFILRTTSAQEHVPRTLDGNWRPSNDARQIQSGNYRIADSAQQPHRANDHYPPPVLPAMHNAVPSDTPTTAQVSFQQLSESNRTGSNAAAVATNNASFSTANPIAAHPSAISTVDAASSSLDGSNKKSIAIPPKGAKQGDRLNRPSSTLGAFLSVATSLAVVLLLFFGVAALYKKAQPASGIHRLPSDVIQVLGRTTAGPRQSLVVLKFGSKLVLVSQQPGQTETISEITDPEEVERLTKICNAQSDSSAAAISFGNVLKQVTSLGRQS